MQEQLIYTDYFDKKYLEYLSERYEYIIKAKDKFLSGWGVSNDKTHIQLILVKDQEELNSILSDLKTDKSFGYINYYPLNKYFYKDILSLKNRYHYTLRNDWKRYK